MQTEHERFAAVSDSGRHYEIVVIQHWRTWTPMSGETQHVKGSKELFTADGQDVSPNGDGTFTVVMTDEILRRVLD